MAEIQAFRGYRYDLGRSGPLSEVVAPPYDVIDHALQDALYAKNPYNVIRLILNREEPGDTETVNRYSRAAGFLRDWIREGVLARDSARALYVYHQEFEVEGRRYTRRGFLARVRLEPFGTGKIYPHEETMPGPKADRLNLFRATGMNLSPVFGLFPDEAGEVQSRLDHAIQQSLPLEASDHLGVISRLWPVTDQKVVSAVTGLMGPRPVFIADGHHRYETALRYLDERRQRGDVRDHEAAANFVLMMLVSMSDPGLVILPTHRLISGIGNLTADRLRDLLQTHFEIERVGSGEEGARQTWDLIEMAGSQKVLGFGTAADGAWQLARYRGNPEIMAGLAPEHSPAWRDLAVSLLHFLVLGQLLQSDSPSSPQCRYVHLLGEAADAARKKECQVAVLVPPAGMAEVAQIAGNLEKMPPKSTYFYPKLLSGLVLNSLTSN
jgi:uncharacterized protein (DUF1015 family)